MVRANRRYAHIVALVALAAPLLIASGCGRIGFDSGERGVADGSMDSALDSGPTIRTRDGGDARGDVGPDPVCGDGDVNGGDECDDGNGIEGDGCDNDCTFSCAAGAACDDGELCNGEEACFTAAHLCVQSGPAPDGTDCALSSQCRGGACAPLGCGDGAVASPEQCDDANLIEGDGCDNDCTFSCEASVDCDDGNSCTRDVCSAANVCQASTPFGDGSACDRDMDPVTRDICLRATCLPSLCGDGFVDPATLPAEECDDGNLTNGDGCDADCTFTCSADIDCADLEACNGTETCNLARHSCVPGTPLADGASCPGGQCASETCLFVVDGGVPSDGGGACWTNADCTIAREYCCGACRGISIGSCVAMTFFCPGVCDSGGG
ncbi:MAG: DUF4215 domain-containing protein [Deltaproteobacteria bacterium]|nr:DUF4215 domain-containing protein [Deltaproteobacteria bacterium]